jgi:hypothetical protein
MKKLLCMQRVAALAFSVTSGLAEGDSGTIVSAS